LSNKQANKQIVNKAEKKNKSKKQTEKQKNKKTKNNKKQPLHIPKLRNTTLAKSGKSYNFILLRAHSRSLNPWTHTFKTIKV